MQWLVAVCVVVSLPTSCFASAPYLSAAKSLKSTGRAARREPPRPPSKKKALPDLFPGVDPQHPYKNLLETLPDRDTSRFDTPKFAGKPCVQICRFGPESNSTALSANGDAALDAATKYSGIFFSFDIQADPEKPHPTIYTNLQSFLTHFSADDNLRGHYERWLLFDRFQQRKKGQPRDVITQVFQTKAWHPTEWERYSGPESVPLPVGTPSCEKFDDNVNPDLANHLQELASGFCWHYIELTMQDGRWYESVTDSVEGAILGETLCKLALRNAKVDYWNLWLNIGLARHESRSRQVRVGTARYFAIMKRIVQGEVFRNEKGEPIFDTLDNPYHVTHPGLVWDIAMEALAVGLQDLDIEFCRWLVSIMETPLFKAKRGTGLTDASKINHLAPLVSLYSREYGTALRQFAAVYDDGEEESQSPEFLIGFWLFWLEARLKEQEDTNSTLQDPVIQATITAARKDYNDMMAVTHNDYRGFTLPSPPPLRVGPGGKYRVRESKWTPKRFTTMPSREVWHDYMQRREPFILSLDALSDESSPSHSVEELYGPVGEANVWESLDGSAERPKSPVASQRARANEIQRRGGTSSSYIRLLHTKESNQLVQHLDSPGANSSALATSSCPSLMKAFGWRTCQWDNEYLCKKAGAETVSLASQNLDNGMPVFSGTSRLRREYVRYCDYVDMIFDPEFNITSPTYFDAGSIAERKSGASSIYQGNSSTGNSIYGFPLDRMREDIPMPSLFEDYDLDPKGVSFWMGAAKLERPGISGLHYDRFDNFHVLLRGRKDWKVFAPSDAENMEYVVPPHYTSPTGDVDQLQGHKQVHYYRYYGYNTVTRFSRAVTAHLNLEYEYDDLPNFHKTTMGSFTLHGGEAVYLPSGWAHDVASSGIHQAITFWFDCGDICDKKQTLN